MEVSKPTQYDSFVLCSSNICLRDNGIHIQSALMQHVLPGLLLRDISQTVRDILWVSSSSLHWPAVIKLEEVCCFLSEAHFSCAPAEFYQIDLSLSPLPCQLSGCGLSLCECAVMCICLCVCVHMHLCVLCVYLSVRPCVWCASVYSTLCLGKLSLFVYWPSIWWTLGTLYICLLCVCSWAVMTDSLDGLTVQYSLTTCLSVTSVIWLLLLSDCVYVPHGTLFPL